MLTPALQTRIDDSLAEIEADGLTKRERLILSPQDSEITVRRAADGTERRVLNLCANNYLGLGAHPELIAAAHAALDSHGFGLASVRFICGTQDIHRQLEREIAAFLGTEDAILFASCFDANGGLFEPLFGPDDAILSDSLNHASIIDGVRLCKGRRYRYNNNDMADLRAQLEAADAAGARDKIIVTDGVFSMDGVIADLPGICELAEAHGALVAVDDCHATGFMGAGGRGTHDYHDCMGRVDILTGTLGKALGGASGGYVAGPAAIVEMLRQRARPYLFSNSLAPALVAGARRAITLVRGQEGDRLRHAIHDNARHFRAGMTAAGFELLPGDHPIVPVMLGDARLAQDMAARLLEEGVYVIGFSYPVVPRGQARIRTQISAAHSREQLDFAIEAFVRVGREFGVAA